MCSTIVGFGSDCSSENLVACYVFFVLVLTDRDINELFSSVQKMFLLTFTSLS